MANEIAKYDGALDEIQAIVKETNLVGGGNEDSIKTAFDVARATSRVSELITDDMMADVMSLQGTVLGFKTDKDRNRDGSKGPGYPVDVVKECFIAMSFYGLTPAGNHWNIISGNPYIAKDGMKAIMRAIPGLDKFKPMYGVPKTGNGAVITSCKATWEYNGKKQSIGFEGDECEIPVNPNNGTAVDQVLGKVERKFLKRVIERVAGCAGMPEGDVDDASVKVAGAKAVEVKVTGSEVIDEALNADKTTKQKIQEQLKADCGGKEAQKAIWEHFTGKTTMTGYTPDEYDLLYSKIGPGGSERGDYELALEKIGGK